MTNHDLILVQEADFDVNQHYEQLLKLNPRDTGAAVLFVGLVRDLPGSALKAMELEHYKGMTEASLADIITKARKRYTLEGVHIVHRVGRLMPHDQIVLVAVTSKHRRDAFSACEYIMDFLKQDAPFWKAEITNEGKQWVAAKDSDQEATARWQTAD